MDILADLNEPQREAVMHVDGPLLVLAGAGSGKTRVITRRLAYMIQQGIPPWQVLAITFTNKAAAEMRERVAALGTPRGSMVCTFHALCARLLRELAEPAGLTSNFSIYDRDDQLKVVKEAVNSLDLSTENFSPARVHSSISAEKNALRTPAASAAQAAGYYQKCVAQIYAKYEQLLAASNAMDFDDLLMRMAFLLRDRKDILELLGRRFRYVMIDEYQDTNHAQYVLAHGIAVGHENICATGDPDQSIYGWRGADIHNILEFEQDYPGAKVVRLEENYRSRAPILSAASHLIAHNKMRKDKALFTRKEGGSDVLVVSCDHEHAEATIVVQRIAAHHAAGGNWDDVAVFYRVNSLSRVVEEALFRAGIPYRIARGVEFYNRKEIKDVLAYLKVLVNPSDDLSLGRIINTPTRGIGNTTISRLEQFAAAHKIPLLEACRQAASTGLGAAAAAKVVAFVAMIDLLRTGLDRSAKEILEDVIRRSGIEKSLAGKEEEQLQARANVDELISSAAEFDANRAAAGETSASPAIEEYLHQISLVSDVDHFEGGSGAVTLMTLHAAKGLEFNVVFIVGCEMGLLPFQRADEAAAGWDAAASLEKLEEERRLAFVGMTRAREQLVLLRARRRKIRGQDASQAASLFLKEIGRECVTRENISADQPASHRARQQFRGGFYDDTHERAAIEAAVAGSDLADLDESGQFPSEYESLHVGSRVRHSKFGLGKVIRLSQPWPQTRVEIIFDDFGQKTLVLALARLTLIS